MTQLESKSSPISTICVSVFSSNSLPRMPTNDLRLSVSPSPFLLHSADIARAQLIFFRDGVSEGQFSQVLSIGSSFPRLFWK